MDFDDLSPKSTSIIAIGEDISTLSVEELDKRIADLRAEIVRVEDERALKYARQQAANAMFKS